MEHEQKCLICGNAASVADDQSSFSSIFINCNLCGRILLDESALHYLSSKEGNKFRACLYYYFTHHRLANGRDFLVIDEKVKSTEKNILTIEEIRNLYPKNISERIDKVLLNFSKIGENIGAEIVLSDNVDAYEYLLFIDKKPSLSEKMAILDMMVRQELLKEAGNIHGSSRHIIDYKGWERIDELNKTNAKHNQGFIAMMFNTDFKYIQERIESAISNSGYIPRVMNNHHHNGQVVPEMLYQIRMSDFLVADLTGNRGGVYFEAGYALGQNKEVIFTVDENLQKEEESMPKKDKKYSPHFDVAQYNQIRYTSPKDLEEQLYARIIATVGDRKKKN